jgi:NADPH:quinone reductase-like Zn-dependent oxidoreductase
MPDDGTYAQLIKIPAGNVHPKPAALSFEEAAALPLAGLTAYRAVVTRAGAGHRHRRRVVVRAADRQSLGGARPGDLWQRGQAGAGP